jgi:hypothetical protein
LKLAVKETDEVASLLIRFDAAFDQFAGMNDGAMVLTANASPMSLREQLVSSREEHGYPPGNAMFAGRRLLVMSARRTSKLGNLALNLLLW